MRVKSRVKKQWRSGSAHLAPSSTVGRLGSAGVKCAWERNHKKEEKGQKEGDPERERGVLLSLRCCRSSVPSAPSSTCRTAKSVLPVKAFSTDSSCDILAIQNHYNPNTEFSDTVQGWELQSGQR